MESDHLSESTRKQRKSLLAFSMFGIVISYIKLSVSKITALGTEITIQDFTTIPIILSIIVLYFLVVFMFNAFDEYSKSHRKYREDIVERIATGKAYTADEINHRMKSLQAEIGQLENATRYQGNEETILANNVKIRDLRQEMDRLEKVINYYQYSKATIFEKIRLEGVKNFVNIYLPILVGLYTIIILLFFTHFDNINPGAKQLNNQKTGVEVETIKADSSSVLFDTAKHKY